MTPYTEQLFFTTALIASLEKVEAAANALSRYNPPDWMIHRLTHIIGECQSMRDALAQHAKEEGAAQ